MLFLSIKLLLKHGPFQLVKSRGQEIYIREKKINSVSLKTEAWMAMYQNTADWLCVLHFFLLLIKGPGGVPDRWQAPFSLLLLVSN